MFDGFMMLCVLDLFILVRQDNIEADCFFMLDYCNLVVQKKISKKILKLGFRVNSALSAIKLFSCTHWLVG